MKIKEKTNSKGEGIWIIAVRVIGFLFFIAPFYLPFISYFSLGKVNIALNFNDYIFSGLGFFLSSGATSIGVIVNNLGIALNKIITKITN